MNMDVALLVLLAALTSSSVAQSGESCVTPDNKQGECINIKQCPFLIALLTKSRPLPPEDLDFLRRSQCGFDGRTPLVCCARQSPQPPIPVPETVVTHGSTEGDPPDASNHPNLKLLPLNICGPVLTDDKITNGNKTEVFEYPWMALIGYNRVGTNRRQYRCGGTIINEKYILTAAHCITNLPNTLQLAGVRLGEHDLLKDIDCLIDEETDEERCADPPVDFDIEEAIPHPEYGRLQNDIALIRIKGTANFRSDTMKPICLPIGNDQKRVFDGSKMIVSGWGTTEKGVSSSVLLKVEVPVIPLEKCASVYNRTSTSNQQPVRITNRQICAGGVDARDSCDGDSGGPLISIGLVSSRPRFVQFGIVSFGPRSCGIKGFPAVYTNIPYYVTWILSNANEKKVYAQRKVFEDTLPKMETIEDLKIENKHSTHMTGQIFKLNFIH